MNLKDQIKNKNYIAITKLQKEILNVMTFQGKDIGLSSYEIIPYITQVNNRKNPIMSISSSMKSLVKKKLIERHRCPNGTLQWYLTQDGISIAEECQKTEVCIPWK